LEELQRDLYTKLFEWFNLTIEHPSFKNFQKNAIISFNFYEGNQLSDTEIQELNNRKQPVIVENRIRPKIRKLLGQYRSQKMKIVYRGRNIEPHPFTDEDESDVLNKIVLHIQQRSGYEFVESDMVFDGFIAGFGVLEVYNAKNELFEKEIIITQEDCLNVFPDPYSRLYDWNRDARFIHRAKWVDEKQFKKLWPDANIDAAINVNPALHDEVSDFKGDNYYDQRSRRIRVIETEFKDYEDQKAYEDTTYTKTVIKKVVWCYNNILSPEKPTGYETYSWIPYFDERKKDGEPYGEVKNLIDPQTEINKRRSKALHLLNTNKTILEEDAVRDIASLKDENALPDGVIEVRPGKIERIKFETNLELAASQMQMHSEAVNAMKEISGIGDDAMGLRSEVRSGIGVARKQAASDQVNVSVFENLRRTRLILGKVLLERIKYVVTPDQVFSITDSLGDKQVFSLSQGDHEKIKTGIYDTIVEEAPDTTTMQEEEFRTMTEFMQTIPIPPPLQPQYLKLLLKMSQLKSKNELIAQIDQISQMTPPDKPKISLSIMWNELTSSEKIAFAQEMQNPQLAQAVQQEPTLPANTLKEQASIQKTQIKAQAGLQQAEMKQSNPQHEMQQAQMDMAQKQQEMQMKDQEHQQNMVQQAQQHQQEMAMKGAEFQQNAQQTAMSHAHQMVNDQVAAIQKAQIMKTQAKNNERTKIKPQ
jgi:hypothetical protein